MNGLKIGQYEIDKVADFLKTKNFKILGGHEYHDQEYHLCASVNVRLPDYSVKSVEIDYKTGETWSN